MSIEQPYRNGFIFDWSSQVLGKGSHIKFKDS